MIISGREIADQLLHDLQQRTTRLKDKEITPTLAVILVGDDAGSASYVRQKEKAALSIGAEIRVMKNDISIAKQKVRSTIHQLNNDQTVHGIIIQRPLPKHLQDVALLNSIVPTKDVDGFVPESTCKVPVAMAVEKILQEISKIKNKKSKIQTKNQKEFQRWLQGQHIVVIGKGETAGKPIAEYFRNMGCHLSVIQSQTPEKEKQSIMITGDIIIICVGKKSVIQALNLKKGVILISVGIWRDEEGKLHGDYEKEDIKNISSFYTPTPGGVGPVNVACLMENLVRAAESSYSTT